jgi:hypothetical protein
MLNGAVVNVFAGFAVEANIGMDDWLAAISVVPNAGKGQGRWRNRRPH